MRIEARKHREALLNVSAWFGITRTVLIASVLCPTVCYPVTLEIRGEFSGASLITRDGERMGTIEMPFRLEFDSEDGSWLIENAENDAQFAAFDGLNVVCAPLVRGAPVGAHSLKVSWLTDAGYPADLEQQYRMLWFMYCAKRYQTGDHNGNLWQPRGEVRHEFGITATHARVEWRQASDLSPASIEFALDGRFLDEAVSRMLFASGNADFLNEREKELEAWKSLAASTNTVVLARVSVDEWIDYEGIGIPEQWTYITFSPGEQRTNGILEGKTISVASIPEVSSWKLPQRAKITDFRLRDDSLGINWGNYSITNGIIPSPQAAVIMAGLPHRPTGDRLLPERHRSISFTVLAVLVAFAGIPIFLLYQRFKSSEHA